jgi:hypothetical protein
MFDKIKKSRLIGLTGPWLLASGLWFLAIVLKLSPQSSALSPFVLSLKAQRATLKT